jgi:hypothetical protein
LNGTGRDQHVGTGRDGIANQELQLASLVAATLKTGKIIALNPQIRETQFWSKILEPM